MILNILKSVVLGIVEGITEFLPISSTGHLIIFQELIKFYDQNENFWDAYLYIIQLGAIIAIILLYWHRLWPFGKQKTETVKISIWATWLKVIIAVIPSVIVGLLLNDWMTQVENWQVVSAMLIIYGIIYIFVENYQSHRRPRVSSVNHLTLKDVLGIGLFQVLSVIPGTSRSGSTILGGLILGAKRETAAEFSFFLSIPTMIGASILKLTSYFKHYGLFNQEQTIVLIVGFVVSFIVAYIAVKWLLNYIQTHDFKAFGVYRIVFGIVIIILATLGVVSF